MRRSWSSRLDMGLRNWPAARSRGDPTEVAWGDHLAQLNFFVKSPVLLGGVVLPGMVARRYGRIVHFDCEVADQPPPGRSRM